MPVISDIPQVQYSDGLLTISLEPPTAIGGHTIQFDVMKRFGNVSGLVRKSVSSGFNAVSGITVTNSGEGVLQISLYESELSGTPYGNLAFQLRRMDSGMATVLSEGYIQRTP